MCRCVDVCVSSVCVRAHPCISDVPLRFLCACGPHSGDGVSCILNIGSWLQERISDLHRFERMFERARERVEDSQRQCDQVASMTAVCVFVCVLLLLEFMCELAPHVGVVHSSMSQCPWFPAN